MSNRAAWRNTSSSMTKCGASRATHVGSSRRARGPNGTSPARPAPLAGERDRGRNQGDTFAVFDHHGDIRPIGMKEQGLFHEGTRFLSCLVLRLGRGDPMFLSSTVKEDNAVLTVDLTNPDVCDG